MEEELKKTSTNKSMKATDTQISQKEQSSVSQLSGTDILCEMKKLFSHTYLAMLSIIQGVALHILIYHAMEYWNNIGEFGLTFIIYFFINLEILCLIWFEYVFIVQFPRILNWKDTVYPISLGVLQIFLAFNITHPQKWLLFVVPTGVIGYLAFHNTRKSLHHWRSDFQPYIADYIEIVLLKKEVGMILATSAMTIFFVVYHFIPEGFMLFGTDNFPVNGLDVFIFIFLSYFTMVNFYISNRIETDFKELDQNILYKVRHLRTDIFYLEPFMGWVAQLPKNR